MHLLVLALAGAAAGALNAVAGGGALIALPALIFAGVAPVQANATASLALWPGGLASAVAYRAEIRNRGRLLALLAGVSALGAWLGTRLLLAGSDASFRRALPWLMVAAASLFTAGGALTRRLRPSSTRRPRFLLVAAQAIVAVYGGYFGGGMGLLILALLSAAGYGTIHEMNGAKTVLGSVINAVAVVSFVLANAIAWTAGLTILAAAVAGGWAGASMARRCDPKWVRRVAMTAAWAMTAALLYATR